MCGRAWEDGPFLAVGSSVLIRLKTALGFPGQQGESSRVTTGEFIFDQGLLPGSSESPQGQLAALYICVAAACLQ